MKDYTFTMAVAIIGVAGFTVTSCVGPGAQAGTLHPCDTLRPALIELQTHRRAGVHPAIIDRFIATDERLNTASRSMLTLIAQAYKLHPEAYRLTPVQFADAGVEFCKATADKPLAVVPRAALPEWGDL